MTEREIDRDKESDLLKIKAVFVSQDSNGVRISSFRGMFGLQNLKIGLYFAIVISLI